MIRKLISFMFCVIMLFTTSVANGVEFTNSPIVGGTLGVFEIDFSTMVITYTLENDLNTYAKIATINGSNIVLGPPSLLKLKGPCYGDIENDCPPRNVKIAVLTPTKIVASYRNYTDWRRGTIRVGTITGTGSLATINFEDEVFYEGTYCDGGDRDNFVCSDTTDCPNGTCELDMGPSSGGQFHSITALNSFEFITTYEDNHSGGEATARHGSVAGTTVLLSVDQWEAGGCRYKSCVGTPICQGLCEGFRTGYNIAEAIDDNRFVYAWGRSTQLFESYVGVGTVTGGDISFGAINGDWSTVFDISLDLVHLNSNTFILIWRHLDDISDPGDNCYALVGTVNGDNSISFNTRSSFATGNFGIQGLIGFSANTFAVFYSDTNSKLYVKNGTVSSGNIIWGPEVELVTLGGNAYSVDRAARFGFVRYAYVYSDPNNGNGQIEIPGCDVSINVKDRGSRYFLATPELGSGQDIAIKVTSDDNGFECLQKYVQLDGTLGDIAIFQTPLEWGTVSVHGDEIHPSVTYKVSTKCLDTSLGNEVGVTTWLDGDVNNNGAVSFSDVTLVVDAFRGFYNSSTPCTNDGDCLGVNPLNECDIVAGFCKNTTLETVDLISDGTVDFDDINDAVRAFRALAFPIPVPCP